MANFAGRRVEREKKGKGSGLGRSFMTSATMGKEAYELRDVAWILYYCISETNVDRGFTSPESFADVINGITLGR